MNRIITTILVAFLFAFTWSFAQEESESEQTYLNPQFEISNQLSVFDNQPIEGTPFDWLHPTPQGNNIRFLKVFDANTWYAIGYEGTFVKTTDGGTTWTVIHNILGLSSTGFTQDCFGGYFFDVNTGLACGSSGNIVRTTDAGETWTPVGPAGATGTVYDFFFLDANTGYFCGLTSSDIWKTTDAGLTWTILPTEIPSSTYSLYAFDEDTIIAGSTGGDIIRTTDGGTTWATIPVDGTSLIWDVNFIDNMNGFAVGINDAVGVTTDAGLTWTPVTTGAPSTSDFFDIDILFPTNADDIGTVYPMSIDLWTGTTDGTTKTDSSEVRAWDTEEGWMMFDLSGIPDGSTIDSVRFYGYVNATNWPWWSATPLALDPLTATASELLDSIEANSGSSAAYIYSNEGSSFVTGWHDYIMGNGIIADLEAALAQDWFPMGLDSRDDDPTYYIVFDGWNEANPPYLEIYYTPAGGGSPLVYLSGDAFDGYYTTDMGATWNTQNVLDPTQPWTGIFYQSDFITNDQFITAGQNGMINKVDLVTDAQVAYTNWIKAGTLYDVWAESKIGNVIAVGSPGIAGSTFDQSIYSTDGGTTWSLSTINGVPSEDFNDICMINSTNGWVAGDEGGIWKTTDGGASWDSLSNVGTNLEEVFFVDANTGYAYGASGDGWKSTDGGLTWSALTTGHGTSIVRAAHFIDANTGWTVGSSGKLFMTTDGGATTTALDAEVGTSTIYSVYFIDANIGFLSGSSGKVRRTTDGGVDWDTIDVGLSSATIYDIEFRDAMYGTAVGSGSRTFTTTDGGDTWDFVSVGAGTFYGVSLENTSPDTAATFVCGSFGAVVKNSSVIVPVELAGFSASVNGNTVTLNWITATEINNAGFEVERKSGEVWNSVGYIEGNGSTTEPHTYSFTDAGLAAGDYNYRIKQIDYDGTYEYHNLSDVVNVAAPTDYNLAQNYPNPFNPSTKITYAVPVDANVTLAVYNMLGEKVATLVNGYTQAGTYDIEFNAKDFSSGVYIYRMESGDFVSVKKMMLLK